MRQLILGYILGSAATTFVVWLTEGRADKNAPDDAGTSEPEQAKSGKHSISQKARRDKRKGAKKWKL